ncbi:hypothetical protein ACQR1I_19495 [Bradyrhizobium sp. HKCCYLS2038]
MAKNSISAVIEPSDRSASPSKAEMQFFSIVLALLSVVLSTVVALAQPDRPMSQSYSQEPGYFYRVQANFEVKATRELLQFDYIVACNVRLTRWRDSSLSDDTIYSPKSMVVATSSGEAVMLRSLNLCSGLTSDNGDVPHDVLPLAIWFDDVSDLSVGVGYLTEDAYASRLSKLAFRGARFERSDRSAWEAWRKKSAQEYIQRGALPGPWGYDFPNPAPENDAYVQTCEAFQRIKIPSDLTVRFRELRPKDRPKFWAPTSRTEENVIEGLVRMLSRSFAPGSPNSGQPLRSGRVVGATPHVASRWPTEVYPLLWPGLLSITPVKKTPYDDREDRFVVNLDFRGGEMNGFAACQDVRKRYIARKKRVVSENIFQIDGVSVKALSQTTPALDIPAYVIEGDEAVFIRSSQAF